VLAQDPTQRFSSRVDNYQRFRPDYPIEIIDLLRRQCGLTPNSLIVDVAFGTGIFTRLLLENGNRVIGVEPNEDMRRAGEEFLAAYPQFQSVAGTAESTTLPERSVDIITAAQAAHWFDRAKARREFARILKPGGWVVLIWNVRSLDSTPFAKDYEQLLEYYGTDYKDVRHAGKESSVPEFFLGSFQQRIFDWRQEFDYAGLEGRLLSSSYTPQAGDPRFQPMLDELRRIFDAHQVNGLISFDYDTRVYCGQME